MFLPKSNRFNRSIHYQIGLFLSILSFILFWFFRPTFMIDPDSFGYIYDVYTHTRSFLVFGRPGFVYFFVPIWEICHHFFKMPILEFYQVIIFINLIFSSLVVFFLYLFIKNITRNNSIGFASTVLFILSRDFIKSAGDVLTEPMMILAVISSFYCYVIAVERKNLFYFCLSAFLFGFGIEIKEVAFLSILFFPIFYLTRSSEKYFDFKKHLMFVLILTVSALIMPVYFYLKDGQGYINSFIYSTSHNNFNCRNWLGVYQIMNEGFGVLFLSIVGLFFLLIRRKFSKLYLILALFLPNIIFSFFEERIGRHFILGFVSLSILTSYGLFYMLIYIKYVLRFSKKVLSVFFIVLLVFLSLYNFGLAYRSLTWRQEQFKFMQDYGLNLLKAYPENVVFIVGEYSSDIWYYILLTKSQKQFIWSGWSWPHEGLGNVVGDYLTKGKRIIVDLDGFKYSCRNEKFDVEKMMSLYKAKRLSGNFFEVFR